MEWIVPIIFIVVMGSILSKIAGKQSNRIQNAGYEPIGPGINYLYMKGGFTYIIPANNVNRAQKIEITGISEIRKNSRLVALEVRYIADGEMAVTRIHGTAKPLLNIMYKLGYE